MRISIFKNQVTQYGVLHHFRTGLARALEKQGVSTPLIDLDNMDRSAFFKAIYASPPDYTLAFNGLQAISSGHFLCDELEIPHIAWLVDSAHYTLEFAKSPFHVLIAPDQKSADMFHEAGAKQAHFLPHAFEASLAAPSDSARTIPIVFLGSLMDPLEIEALWKQHLPEDVVKGLVDVCDKTLDEKDQTYQEAFEYLLEEHFAFFSTLTEEKTTQLAISLDGFIRAKDRINLLKALQGLPVHIYGNCLSNRNWGDFLDLSNGNYSIFPAVNFDAAIDIMKNAKIVLNSSPMFKTGAHERIFYGLGLGAAVLTNETPWNQHHFSKDELLVYSPARQSQVYDQISDLLNHPKKLCEIAFNGQKKVLKEHTWDVRATQLLQILNDYTQ